MSLSSLQPEQAADANDKLEASDAEAEKLKVGLKTGDEEVRKAKAEAAVRAAEFETETKARNPLLPPLNTCV
eukprot:4807275-Pleurochrysis_carterae.AAC.1